MEKAFKVNENHEYYKSLKKYQENLKIEKQFVAEFSKNHGIKSKEYYIGGNGFVNVPFEEFNKKNIGFAIVPTDEDIETFGAELNKENENGLRFFRKNSKLLKLFQEDCIKNKIIVNLSKPYLGNYFKSIYSGRISYSPIFKDKNLYLQVSSRLLQENDVPEGFKEIKMSEFHKIKEESI